MLEKQNLNNFRRRTTLQPLHQMKCERKEAIFNTPKKNGCSGIYERIGSSNETQSNLLVSGSLKHSELWVVRGIDVI